MKRTILASLLMTAFGASAQTVSCPPGGPLSWVPPAIKVLAPPFDWNHRYRRFSARFHYPNGYPSRSNRLTYISGVMNNARGQQVLINPLVPAQTPMAVGLMFKNTHSGDQYPYLDGLQNSWSSTLPYPIAETRPGGFVVFAANAIELSPGIEYQINGRFTYTPSPPSLFAAVHPHMGNGDVQVLAVIGKRDPDNVKINYRVMDCEGRNYVEYWGPHDVTFPVQCVIATYGFTSPDLQAQVRSPLFSRPVTKAVTKGLFDMLLPATLHDETPLTGRPSLGLC